MLCECDGILEVICVEDPQIHLSKSEKLVYQRLMRCTMFDL
jgi:hypothetical protein